MRSQTESGFFLALSGMRCSRTFRPLDECVIVHGLDDHKISHLGSAKPPQTRFDVVCTLSSNRGFGLLPPNGDILVNG